MSHKPLPPCPPPRPSGAERAKMMSNSRKSQKSTTAEPTSSNHEVPFPAWSSAPTSKATSGSRAVYLLALEKSRWVAEEALAFITKEDHDGLAAFTLTNDDQSGWWIFSHVPVSPEFQGCITGYIARLREEENARQEKNDG